MAHANGNIDHGESFGISASAVMRMIKTNVPDTMATLDYSRSVEAKKYLAVSTDKSKNPANLMGATKRIAEGILFDGAKSKKAVISARFANVTFSDGGHHGQIAPFRMIRYANQVSVSRLVPESLICSDNALG